MNRIILDESIHRKLMDCAHANGKTTSQLVNEICEAFIGSSAIKQSSAPVFDRIDIETHLKQIEGREFAMRPPNGN